MLFTFENILSLYSGTKGIRIHKILSSKGWISHKVAFNIPEEIKALKDSGVTYIQLALEFGNKVESYPDCHVSEFFA